jgi:hypothetical protein
VYFFLNHSKGLGYGYDQLWINLPAYILTPKIHQPQEKKMSDKNNIYQE